MRSLAIRSLALLAVVSWGLSSVSAGDIGQSDSIEAFRAIEEAGLVEKPISFEQMGLSAITELTDDQGMSVRGQAFVAPAIDVSFVTGLLVDPLAASYIETAGIQFAHESASAEGLANGLHSQLLLVVVF
jgi:hypothetical protein